MPKYYPIPNGIKFQYDETANAEKTMIHSSWKVDLSTNETIEVQHYVDIGTYIFYVELYVKSTGGPAGDHTWEGSTDIVICPDKEYDPAEVSDLSEKQNIVRAKIMDLLTFFNSDHYDVIAKVTRENMINGNTSSEKIGASGDIQIIN